MLLLKPAMVVSAFMVQNLPKGLLGTDRYSEHVIWSLRDIFPHLCFSQTNSLFIPIGLIWFCVALAILSDTSNEVVTDR
jgi:hypothetical protein